jgi:hypothetical protein
MLRRFAGWLLALIALDCGDPNCVHCNPTEGDQ